MSRQDGKGRGGGKCHGRHPPASSLIVHPVVSRSCGSKGGTGRGRPTVTASGYTGPPSQVATPLSRVQLNGQVASRPVPAEQLSKCRQKQHVARSASISIDLGSCWNDVLAQLNVREIVATIAPVCTSWRQLAKSKELWIHLRPRIRLVDQLFVIEKLIERRSKGRLFQCGWNGPAIGGGGPALVRIVDLKVTNAGKDDGIPSSFMREASLLASLKHPNVIRFLGAELVGQRAFMCTEFVHTNFSEWHKSLTSLSAAQRIGEIRNKYRQLFTGLTFIHGQGVMHRNLKPDNIFLTDGGQVKLGDFSTSRMLDVPLQPYTPEDPKERDRSSREVQRLWYRAPELILRDEIYGPKVDMWSVGCLLAEAANGKTLFKSEQEIDHVFRVFRLIGTPSTTWWPEALTTKNFSPKFAVYSALSFAKVARAACFKKQQDLVELQQQAGDERRETLRNLLEVASVVGPNGMYVLDRILAVPPAARLDGDAVLELPFFEDHSVETTCSSTLRQDVSDWLREQQQHSSASSSSSATVKCSPQMTSSIHSAMRRLESDHYVGLVGVSRGAAEAAPRAVAMDNGIRGLPPGFTAEQRATIVDFIAGTAASLELSCETVHVAVSIFDKLLSMEHGIEIKPTTEEDEVMRLAHCVAATCLKIADVFAEQSKEYYRQENIPMYAERLASADSLVSQRLRSLLADVAEQKQQFEWHILACEKDVLPKIQFSLRMPTTNWFVRCYLEQARLRAGGVLGRTADFFADLLMLDYDMQVYAPSLRAQCVLLLAAYVVHCSAPRASRSAASTPASSCTSRATGSGSGSEQTLQLRHLHHWDAHARESVCEQNLIADSLMSLQAAVRAVVTRRREWKVMKLTAVEEKNESLVRSLTCPETFPIYELVWYMLPDHERDSSPLCPSFSWRRRALQCI